MILCLIDQAISIINWGVWKYEGYAKEEIKRETEIMAF